VVSVSALTLSITVAHSVEALTSTFIFFVSSVLYGARRGFVPESRPPAPLGMIVGETRAAETKCDLNFLIAPSLLVDRRQPPL